MKLSNIKVLPGFYVLLAFGILIVPFKWLVAWIVAAFVHELFHLIFLRMSGYDIVSIEIGMLGASIKTNGQSGIKMSLCALAGPLGGFLLLMLLRFTPRLALCGAIQSLYNLIPIYPLDGGRAVRGVVERVFPPRTAKYIILILEDAVIILLVAIAVYSAVRLHLGLYPALWVGILLCKNKKIPCKQGQLRVQ